MIPLVRLGDVCDMRSGGTPRRGVDGYYGGTIPWVTIADISACDGVVTDTAECITEAGLTAIGNRLFREGTILLAMYGSVGKLAIAGRRLATNQAILGICPRDPGVLDPRYLKWWLASIQPRLVFDARGVTQGNISKGIVEELRIPLPASVDQRRIADTLDRADAVRRKREEAALLTEQLLSSAFLDMFGSPATNPKRWPQRAFEEVVRDATGGNPKVQQADYRQNGAYPIIDQGADFVGGWTDDSAMLASVRLPAVLFGDHTKTLKWVESPFVLGADGVKVLEPGGVLTPEFLYSACRLFPFPDVGYSRHFKFLKAWRLPVPPLEDQVRYASVFRRVRGGLPTLRAAAAEAASLCKRLLADSFSKATVEKRTN